MTYVGVTVAGVRISFWTSHSADRECLEEILLYHINKNEVVSGTEDCHDVIITSGMEKFRLPENKPLVWTGHINRDVPICWYNPTDREENVITIAGDILIRHFSGRNLTICYLREQKTRFFRSHRPLLTNYIFFLLHSILSMHRKYCLHASCASRNGRAYLFLGKSGEGKSTMSAILGKAGFEYMGDDLAFIFQNEKDEIIVDSFLSKIKLINSKSKTKDSIDIIKDRHFKYVYQSKLGTIIKLQRTASSKKSILIPATQAESFAWLMNSGNNIRIQYHQQLWMNVCERASLQPSFTLMFADKKYFEPDILKSL